jgi:hypothetical protein
VASITPSASSTPAEVLRGARLPALQAPCVPPRRWRAAKPSGAHQHAHPACRDPGGSAACAVPCPRASERSPVKFGRRCAQWCKLPWRPRNFARPACGPRRVRCGGRSRARVRPHKMSVRCLACFRVRRMWVSARSDAACVCMCARGSGNALFEHVFRSCGCHRAAAGLTSSSKDCTASFYIVAEQGIGSRGHALAVGPSHCDNWSTFGICLECLWLEYTLM